MKQSLSIIAVALFAYVLPVVMFAASLADGDDDAGDIGGAMGDVLRFIDAVIIPVVLSVGFLFFVWGMFLYFIKGGHSDEDQESGKKLMAYAIAGFVIVLSFWGIINLITGGIGLEGGDLNDIPSANQID